ncbi:hypothetical protein [Streptomyces sp. ISL-1]|uniref:hypothetical protein n=1 Tax=unclassified Streptomyces TaxID=2593676 RepID=UPI001BE8A194|nr:hypothetical protein [Streptomyces sp. ISL-1]MBT2389835.1 hypothetical protein [Streptomyces sp. ISL-1]
MTRHTEVAPKPVTTGTEITRTDCKQCGTEVHGIDGRYSCPLCGWVNHWSEGHNELPAEVDNPGPTTG